MDRLRTLSVFVAVAEEAGFAPAARRLNMSPPSVTRAVSELEARLGVPLLHRTTRTVMLTDAGTRYLADCRRILIDLEEAEEAAIGSHGAPRGELRITTPAMFGRLIVTPILGDFLDQFPLVTCRTLFVDRVVNMFEEGLDVAIRIGDLPDSSLIAQRVGTVRWSMFAAPDYLKEHGRPEHPRDLAQHRLLQSVAIERSSEWPYWEDGEPHTVRIEPRLRMNTNDATADLAARGWGISRLISYQIAAHIADGRVETILDEFAPPPFPIHIVHHEGRTMSAKVRAFVDFMAARLRADPAIN